MPYAFPDSSNFPKGIDGHTIFGGSIGSNRIFNYFREAATQLKTPNWDLYLINVNTLVRNAYQKDISQFELEQAVDRDSDLYMTYIGAYTTYRRLLPSVVFFYAPDYSAVPKDMMRIHTGQQAIIDGMYEELLKKLPSKLMELTEIAETRKFICRVGKTTFPHKDMIDKIRSIYNGQRTQGVVGTVMVSHLPIDYHIYKTIPTIQLLESFTGVVLPVRDFGQKLTKEVKIPFNTTTHRLFGDGIQLTPLLKGKDRTKLIEVATEFKWDIKTESEISGEALFKFSNISLADLTILRL